MNDVTFAEINQQIDTCAWSVIQPHVEKSNLFIIADDIDLAEVAFLIAKDEAEKTKALIEKNHIFRITPELHYTWDQIPDKKFKIVIIAPYLLIQEVLDS